MQSRGTLYVVDDDDDVRESAELLLEAVGYNVTTYASGVDFLQMANLTVPACVLLDIHMPLMDGLEVQRQLTAKGVNFPVIVLTGQGDIAIAVQAMKNGAFEFLEKPYLNDVLQATVRDAFLKLLRACLDPAAPVQRPYEDQRADHEGHQQRQGSQARGLPARRLAFILARRAAVDRHAWSIGSRPGEFY